MMIAIGKSNRRKRQLSLALVASLMIVTSTAFSRNRPTRAAAHAKTSSLHMSDWNDPTNDSNTWKSAGEEFEEQEDWQEMMARKNDGSFWSDFEPSPETDETRTTMEAAEEEEIDEADVWLNTLASISADEVEFNMAEAERADKVRQMQEWGFDDSTISNTYDVAVDDALEKDGLVQGMQEFVETGYLEEEDWKTVESHSKVETDDETGEPIRQQMVTLRSNLVHCFSIAFFCEILTSNSFFFLKIRSTLMNTPALDVPIVQ
jgi:hypothetical protein